MRHHQPTPVTKTKHESTVAFRHRLIECVWIQPLNARERLRRQQTCHQKKQHSGCYSQTSTILNSQFGSICFDILQFCFFRLNIDEWILKMRVKKASPFGVFPLIKGLATNIPSRKNMTNSVDPMIIWGFVGGS